MSEIGIHGLVTHPNLAPSLCMLVQPVTVSVSRAGNSSYWGPRASCCNTETWKKTRESCLLSVFTHTLISIGQHHSSPPFLLDKTTLRKHHTTMGQHRRKRRQSSPWSGCAQRCVWSAACACTLWVLEGSAGASPCFGSPHWALLPASAVAPEEKISTKALSIIRLIFTCLWIPWNVQINISQEQPTMISRTCLGAGATGLSSHSGTGIFAFLISLKT